MTSWFSVPVAIYIALEKFTRYSYEIRKSPDQPPEHVTPTHQAWSLPDASENDRHV